METVKLKAAVICAVLALLNPTTTQTFSSTEDGEPDEIVILLKSVLKGRDGNQEIEFETTELNRRKIGYALMAIGEGMVNEGINLL